MPEQEEEKEKERESGGKRGAVEERAVQKVNCWSEFFIGSVGGREREWEYALKTTV